ncbi:MAG: phosphomannose isomerase type II C-terminal cupin domain [Patescibacteria group bacterium]|nr:phosphomannose isomerase type II C-terminal cupin domain [Patescibacteria group bacterium]MDE1945994.1 phosphomannose isomerase type II C-terminal cupin domain [Patescibacteria group bacterium]
MKMKYDKRPWGEEEIFTMNERTTVKILTVNPGEACSLQYHEHRTEFWKIIEGNLSVIIGKATIAAKLGDEFEVQPKTNHRLIGGTKPAKILEISFGDFDESDIVRLEDRYGRK